MSNDEVDMLLEEAGIDDDGTFRYEQFVDNLMNQSEDFWKIMTYFNRYKYLDKYIDVSDDCLGMKQAVIHLD